MVKLNNEIVLLKTEINLLKGESPEQIMIQGNILNQQLHHRWLMIAGEGFVFLLLLAIGILQIQRTFRKEKLLAQQQKNFLLSVTHELKSPIASTKLQLQTLQKHELSREKQLEIIANAISDAERLNHLAENILVASKIENNIISIHKELGNVSDLATDLVNQFAKINKGKQTIVTRIDTGIEMQMDKMIFPSIVFNLLENAAKYSSTNTTITVQLQKKNNAVIMNIIDEGIGIKEEEKEKIFEKFYRVGSEETRNTKGTGLGLYITKHLVALHNGEIEVKNNSPKGCNFELSFWT